MQPDKGIRSMLSARSVAIVGASDDKQKIGYRPVEFLLRFGYKGQIFPVSRKLAQCCGLVCYPTLSSIPEVPDLVVVVVSAGNVASVIEEAGRLGIASAIILSSGFAELGPAGETLQNEVARIAASFNMVLCGPNSVGVVHEPTALTATFTEALTRGNLVPGTLGIVSQSGAYGTVILAETRERGIGVRTYVSSGNEATTRFGDYLGALIDDAEIHLIGGYVEGIRDGANFRQEALRARQLGKPVVLMKAGYSKHGQAAASSHTGALAGRDEAYSVAFRRFGIARVNDDETLVDLLDAFDTLRHPPGGNRVAIVTMSGGAGVLLSDLVENTGLVMAELSTELRNTLRDILPPFASVDNPIDLTGQFVSDTTGLKSVLTLVAKDPLVDLIIVYGGLGWTTETQWLEAVQDVADAGYVAITVLPLATRETCQRFRDVGVPVYSSAAAAIRVAHGLVSWSTNPWWEKPEHASQPQPTLAHSTTHLSNETGLLSETKAKDLLQAIGLRVPNGKLFKSGAEARLWASQFANSVVLKVDVPGLVHKTDVGGVELAVPIEEIETTFEQMLKRFEDPSAGTSINGIRVEEMAHGGIEFIIGVVPADPFGMMIGVGMGGTSVELLGKMAFDLVPVTMERAKQMILSLSGAALLEGFRSQEPHDIDELARAICVVSDLANSLGNKLLELDLNPVLVQRKGQGVIVLDAAIVLA